MAGHTSWADDFEDEGPPLGGDGLDRPEDDGTLTRTKYETDPSGRTVKIEKKIRTTTKTTRVNALVVRRSKLKCFGLAASESAQKHENAYRDVNDIHIELPKKAGEGQDNYFFQDLPGKSFSLRNKFNLIRQADKAAKAADSGLLLDDRHVGFSAKTEAADGPQKYVAPHRLRPATERPQYGGPSWSSSRGGEEHTLRVSNLSDEVTEADLQELFRSVGRVSRVFLVKDRETSQSKGFAYITYPTRSEAERAIENINRHGYDNLLLSVEWSRPRSTLERPAPQ